MKKLISLLMILAVLLSLCACGQSTKEPTDAPTEATTEATEAPGGETENPGLGNYTPEQLYGHIDQTKPDDKGVYKLWNKDGVANMVNAPDGTFELLCNIDMEGASLSPIGTADKPFTGKIDGKNFIISNFTLTSEGEALGFVGVNEGSIQDLQLESSKSRDFLCRETPAGIHTTLQHPAVGARDIQQHGIECATPLCRAWLGPIMLRDLHIAPTGAQQVLAQGSKAEFLHIRGQQVQIPPGRGQHSGRFATGRGAGIQHALAGLG